MRRQFSDKISAEQFVKWANNDNNTFYEGLTLQDFQDFAVAGGLDSCCDMKLIRPYLDPEGSILEVGAGYGRVLDYLVKNNFKNLFAVERTKGLCDLLKSKYAAQSQVKLFEGDLRNLRKLGLDYSDYKFDSMLLLWSFIAEFSKEEQPEVIKFLAKFLKPGGKMFVDSMPPSEKPVGAIAVDGRNYVVRVDDKVIYGYFPSTEEIEEYGTSSKLKKNKDFKYRTITGRRRFMYILANY